MISDKKRKLLLIHPTNKARKGFLNDKSTRFMPLGLGIVAALTPSDWEIELLDESFEEFSFKEADLVGLSCFTSGATRAYEIAKIYKDAGIHTVIGGIHASMCPEEAGHYVDTVFTGEAEGAWPQLIIDFEKGQIRPLYEGGMVEADKISPARRDIYKYPYTYDLVQTTRGCPWICDFCSVSQMSGKSYRERRVEDVLDELEKTTRTMLFFVDDNLVNFKHGAKERAISLFKGMVDRGIKKHWLSQAAVNFADDEEVLHWAHKAGCTLILMGIEAEKPEALKDVRKNLNLKRGVQSYDKVFRRLHKHGISVLATLIFAMENDTIEDLYNRAKFIKETSIDSYQITILTPLPGTTLFQRLKEQNRILMDNYPEDWQHYHYMVPLVKLNNMAPGEVEHHMHEICLDLFDKATMRKKMFRTLWNTRNFMAAYWAYASNHNYGRIFLEQRTEDIFSVSVKKHWKRTLYLKFTNTILFLMYQLVWGRMLRKIAAH